MRVGVDAGGEAGRLQGQFPENEIDDASRDFPEQRRARQLIGFEVHVEQLRVVVQHLLEVRHPPGPVGGVAVEAAAHVVVDAAGGHMAEREVDHLPGCPVSRRRITLQQER